VTVEKASEIAIFRKSLHDAEEEEGIGWNDDVLTPSQSSRHSIVLYGMQNKKRFKIA